MNDQLKPTIEFSNVDSTLLLKLIEYTKKAIDIAKSFDAIDSTKLEFRNGQSEKNRSKACNSIQNSKM